MTFHDPAGLLESLWDPPAGRKVWDRLASASQTSAETLASSPDHGRAVLNFLTFSPASLAKICRRPELLEWLSHNDVQNPKPTSQSNWCSDRSDKDLSFRHLRLWKSQEMLRIAFREISGFAGRQEREASLVLSF